MEAALTTTLRCLPLLLAWLGLLALPSAVFAHRLDKYLQATLVAIEPTGIKLQINLTPGVAVAEQVLAEIDRDHDGVISTQEAAAYAELVKRELMVRLNDRTADLKLTASYFPEPEELRTGFGIIQMEFSLSSSAFFASAHKLVIENHHLPTIGVYLFNAAQPKSSLVEVNGQKRNENQSVGEIEFTFHPPVNSSRSIGNVVMIAVFAALLLMTVCAGIWWAVKSSQRAARVLEKAT